MPKAKINEEQNINWSRDEADKLDKIITKMDKIEKVVEKIYDIEKSIAFISNEFEKFRKDIEDVKKEMKDKKKEIKDMKSDVLSQNQQIIELGKEVENLLNREKNKNAEIKGIPVKVNEDLLSLVGKIASKAGVKIEQKEITSLFRLKSKQETRSSIIIVKFASEEVRNSFIMACKKARLSLRDIGEGGDVPIYANEDVSWITRRLFGKAMELKRKEGFAYCWIKRAKVYLRLKPDGPALWVQSQEDLRDLK